MFSFLLWDLAETFPSVQCVIFVKPEYIVQFSLKSKRIVIIPRTGEGTDN